VPYLPISSLACAAVPSARDPDRAPGLLILLLGHLLVAKERLPKLLGDVTKLVRVLAGEVLDGLLGEVAKF